MSQPIFSSVEQRLTTLEACLVAMEGRLHGLQRQGQMSLLLGGLVVIGLFGLLWRHCP